MKNELAVALRKFTAVSTNYCKLVFDSSANRNKIGTLSSVQSGKEKKERVLIKYFLTMELSVEVTVELQWKNEVMT